MKTKNRMYLILFFILTSSATNLFAQSEKAGTKRVFETFLDAQKKPGYPPAVVYSPSGDWMFDGALVYGTEKLDIRPMSPRILGPRSTNNENGYISTEFDIKGITKIKVGFIGFKADDGYFAVEVFISKDGGRNWASLGIRRGDPTKEEETIAEFKMKPKKGDSYRVKIANASAPKSNRLNRINITEVEIEYND